MRTKAAQELRDHLYKVTGNVPGDWDGFIIQWATHWYDEEPYTGFYIYSIGVNRETWHDWLGRTVAKAKVRMSERYGKKWLVNRPQTDNESIYVRRDGSLMVNIGENSYAITTPDNGGEVADSHLTEQMLDGAYGPVMKQYAEACESLGMKIVYTTRGDRLEPLSSPAERDYGRPAEGE